MANSTVIRCRFVSAPEQVVPVVVRTDPAIDASNEDKSCVTDDALFTQEVWRSYFDDAIRLFGHQGATEYANIMVKG